MAQEIAEISAHDQEALRDIGFIVTGYLSHGSVGDVFEGIGTDRAFAEVPIKPGEVFSGQGRYSEDGGCMVRRVCLQGVSCAIKKCNLEHNRGVAYNEAQALKTMLHPNIVQVYEVCRIRRHDESGNVLEDNMYIIMEFMSKGNLQSFLDESDELDEYTGVQMMSGLTAGLEYMHTKGKFHADLHIENVMVSKEGDNVVCKIVDLGQTSAAADPRFDISNLLGHLSKISMQTKMRSEFDESITRDMERLAKREITLNHFSRVLSHFASQCKPVRQSPIKKLSKWFRRK